MTFDVDIPTEDEFVSAYRKYSTNTTYTDDHIRRKYRKAMVLMFGGKRDRAFGPKPGAIARRSSFDLGAQYVPELAPGRPFVPLSSIPECKLPPYMQEIIRSLPDGMSDVPVEHDVYFNALTGIYYTGGSGICTPYENAVQRELAKHDMFAGLYPLPIEFGHIYDFMVNPTHVLDDFYRQVLKVLHKDESEEEIERRFAANEQRDEILSGVAEDNMQKRGRAEARFRTFVSKKKYVAMTASWGYHVFAFVKDPDHERVVILDPNGTDTLPEITPYMCEYLTNVIRGKEINRVEFVEHIRDQGREGACGVISLMRCLYLLHKSRSRPSSAVLFINNRIPCVFAVFISTVLQKMQRYAHVANTGITSKQIEENLALSKQLVEEHAKKQGIVARIQRWLTQSLF